MTPVPLVTDEMRGVDDAQCRPSHATGASGRRHVIVTLTANPSLDRTIGLSSLLRRGGVLRAISSDAQPGGKGVNVSRALLAARIPTLAVLPGRSEDPMLLALAAERIPSRALPIAGVLRSNVTITEPDGTTTKVNEPGPHLTEADAAALVELVVTASRGAAWLVLAGSLPPGLPADFYARVIGAVRADGPGPRIAVDSSGAPLAALLEAGVEVDLVKPNADELAELLGLTADAGTLFEADPSRAAAAARALLDRGFGAVLTTLGSAGAVLTTVEGGWTATMPPIEPRSTVGAGDAALAGYLIGALDEGDPSRCLAQAVAHGAAAAALPGSTMPTLEQTHPSLAAVRRDPDPDPDP